jgi:DNA-binding LytR/AlgR family response regulator
VEHCASAPDALRFLKQDARFDLVFSDLVMAGGMDGLDLARIARERWPAIPILKKPYRPAELEWELRRLLSPAGHASNVLPLRPRQV